MNIEGLDYNTEREKLKLKAYGREIQQMVEVCMTLPTKEERQACAETIITAMNRVLTSNLSKKERKPMLWYHLALMSDFKLDIDYPVDIQHEDKSAAPPARIPYTNKTHMHMRHYGRLTYQLLEQLKTMEPSPERDELAMETAYQMLRTQQSWGTMGADTEKVVCDMAQYTNGNIRMTPDMLDASGKKRKHRR